MYFAPMHMEIMQQVWQLGHNNYEKTCELTELYHEWRVSRDVVVPPLAS